MTEAILLETAALCRSLLNFGTLTFWYVVHFCQYQDIIYVLMVSII